MSTSSDAYKRQIMQDLSGGNVESLDAKSTEIGDNYDNFDDFARRSSRDERKHLFSQAFKHDRISSTQMEPELHKAISQIKPNERDDVAKEFLKQLSHRGLKDRDLEKQLGLSTHHASHMNADDVSKLASFAYHNHPDIFQDVLADQPGLVKLLSNPLVGAALGAIAAKWMGHR